MNWAHIWYVHSLVFLLHVFLFFCVWGISHSLNLAFLMEEKCSSVFRPLAPAFFPQDVSLEASSNESLVQSSNRRQGLSEPTV